MLTQVRVSLLTPTKPEDSHTFITFLRALSAHSLFLLLFAALLFSVLSPISHRDMTNWQYLTQKGVSFDAQYFIALPGNGRMPRSSVVFIKKWKCKYWPIYDTSHYDSTLKIQLKYCYV